MSKGTSSKELEAARLYGVPCAEVHPHLRQRAKGPLFAYMYGAGR